MLQEIELFVGGGFPEVLPLVGQGFFVFLTLFIGDGHAALLPEGRVCQHIIHLKLGLGD
ncbi:hypothetical protein D3C78_1513170 [compost metagenome]